MRGAATENALFPIFRLARLTMTLLLLDDRNDGRDDGSLAAGVSRSLFLLRSG